MKQEFKNILKTFRDNIRLFLLLFKTSSYSDKVFCIGFNKTGTTSLGRSLELLGFDNISFNRRAWRKYYQNKQYDKLIKLMSKFDSADDLPWLKEDMIPILDENFPRSKFIYLDRDEESWKKSIYKWTFKKTGEHPEIESKLLEFRNHKAFVLDYFKDRHGKDFIRLDIRDPNGFEKLADFLNKESIRNDFPHFNDTTKLYGK